MTGDGAVLSALLCKCKERDSSAESRVSPDSTCTLQRADAKGASGKANPGVMDSLDFAMEP
jgi:hypothetical protein